MKTCQVVILNWNGADMLRRFLPSVVEHSQAFTTSRGESCSVEVVVADNGSTDDSLTVLSSFPSVRTTLLDRNYGFAEGYNRALAHTTADYTVLLNSDVQVTPRWLEPVINYMEEHAEVVAAQPKILAHASLHEHPHRFEHAGAAGGFIDILGYPFCRGRVLATVEDDHGQYDTLTDIFWASGACLFCRTQAYHDAGGLDPAFFAHMEEIDLCWRLQALGHRIVCVPQSEVFHVGGGSLSYESPRKTYLNFRNNLLMLYKNLPSRRLWWVMTCRLVLDYVAALQLLLTGQRANAKAAVQARRDYHRLRLQYRALRQQLQKSYTNPLPHTIKNRSIIFAYYLLGKKTF